jgi:hypothetical protein
MRLRTAALSLGLSFAAACGTTVPAAESGTGGGNGLGGPAAAGADAQGGTGAVGSGIQAGATDQSGAGARPGSRSDAGTGGATHQAGPSGSIGGISTPGADGSIATKGPGWDAKHIYLGVMTQRDFQKAAASVGYSGIDPGNTQAQAQAVVDQLNRQGGAYGRTLALRTFDVPTISSAQNPDTYAESACTYFTQDAPVVAVINIVLTIDTPNFRQCFAKHHIPLFNAGDGGVSKADAALAPYFFSLGTPAWEALAPVLVKRLKAQGYFHGWDTRLSRTTTAAPVIGVLVSDTTVGHEDGVAIAASLRAAGYSKIITYAYPPPGSEIDGAVLNFAQNGVTHVISDDIELVTFQLHAQSQKYAPRYGINTYNAPGLNLTQIGPKSQQIGDVGVGYGPTFDVTAANGPRAVGPGVTTCRAMMSRAHVTSSDRLAEAFAMLVCDAVRLSVRGMIDGHGLDGRAISAGAMADGPTFQPAFTIRSGLDSARQFMPAAVRDLAYVPACSCFRYASSTSFPM